MKAVQRRAPPRRHVDGVLLLDKPSGLSSNAALQHAKRLFNAAKAGHTGTLDPLATGLLPLCFGEATKFAQLLLEADKAYAVTIRLGQVTTTGDAEGEITRERPVEVARPEFEAALPRFIGRIAQRAPRHAALKYQGRNYYEYAREGIEIPRAEREVVIQALAIKAWAPPDRRTGGAMWQGNLYTRAGGRPWRGARLRRACRGASADRDRRIPRHRSGDARLIGRTRRR